ncbi:MAG: hypothetical protein WAN59_06960 [Candidatus Baltobacteraceae bacterium]
MIGAIGQLRENRRRGIKTDPSKTFTTVAGCVLITLLATGAMAAGSALGHPTLGVVCGVVLIAGGLTALIIAVNRRWPPQRGAGPP